MLQEILALFRENQGASLAKDAISARLNIPTDVLEQMLQTLVRHGRLVEIDGSCTGCSICSLEKFCATTPTIIPKGYALVQSQDD